MTKNTKPEPFPQPKGGLSGALIPHSQWLTAAEAAGYLKVKVRTLLLWVRQGKVRGFALSGTKRRVWRFRQADLDAALVESVVLPSELPSVLVKGIP